MAVRESRIDGIRLYSDNLESDNSKASKTVQSYQKVETTTTTKTVIKEGSKPTKTKVSKRATLKKNLGVPRKSISTITGNIQEMLAAKQGEKEKYVYSGKLKEKSNYLYYVSGVGYVTKEGIPVKDNKPREIKVTKPKPKPTRVVGERVTIVIQNTKTPKKGGDLVENFQYFESKDIGKNNRQSTVVHKRKGDPFYQSIDGKRNSSYTHGDRSRTTYKKSEIQSKTIDTETTQKNQYQNRTTKVTQTGTGGGNKNYSQSSYQRTINVEERKRNIIPKSRFEKTYTQTNKRAISVDQKKYIPPQKKYQEKTDESYKRTTQTQKVIDTQKYKRNTPSQKVIDTEKYKKTSQTQKVIDTQKYKKNTPAQRGSDTEKNKRNSQSQSQRGSDTEQYKRNSQAQSQRGSDTEKNKRNSQSQSQRGSDTEKYKRNSQSQSQKGSDTEKYKRNSQPQRGIDNEQYNRNIDQSKYQQRTEETQQTRISQEQNMLSDPNYCPIHGYHGQYNIEDVDNYKFYESKRVSRKEGSINTNINNTININRKNIVNTEENINSNAAYINAMNQEQMAQTEDGYDLSKLYIATKITPVYSEMLDQQFQPHTHVCKVCGNPYFDPNQTDMMQQNQINSMQEMEYDINCPIHGQNFSQ